MTLDKLQTRFVDEVLHGDTHLILTGRAGTGKSTALVAAVRAAQAAGMDVLVMAPTAMAASIHRDAGLQSGTIHHALKWNPAKEPLPRKLLSVCGMYTDWAATPDQDRLLVVDEASMVGLWMFEILARDLGDPERPFDGRRLVVVGDWAQLPPVVGSDEQNMAMPELKRFGPPDGCIFFHPLFCRRPPVSIILEETHRANGAWFESLNLLRECSRPSNLLTFGIAPSQHTHHDEDSVHMCFRRVTAHNRNAECLARLPGRPHFLPLRDGEAELKEGCDVIVTSNRAGGDYINGSRATFAGVNEKGEVILDDGNALKMLADGNWGYSAASGSKHDVDPDAAEYGRNKAIRLFKQYGDNLEPEGKKWLQDIMRIDNAAGAARFGSGRIQFMPYWPVLPGYALTVHKAQGSTLSGVVIEEDIFWSIAPARLPYVALSRVADEANVSLAGFLPSSARVRPDPAYPAIFNRIQAWSKS